MNRRLVLLAHGSAEPAWRRPFAELAATLQSRLGVERVSLAFMELAAPTLLDVAEQAARNGDCALRILPLFLAGGAHIARDIPAQVAELTKRFPRIEVELLPPVGEDPRVRALFLRIAEEYASGAPPGAP